jgi:hypothetical protein
MFIKAFFFLITLFSGFFLVGCGGGGSSGNVSNTTNAQTPNIIFQPVSATYIQGNTVNPLSVTTTVSDGGVLSYQWYKNSINSNNGGIPISGATNSSFTPPTSDIGTTYYYIVITNTNDGVNGVKTANASSDTARIAIGYLVSFYDENLDHVVTVNAANGSVDLSSISNTPNPWYEANSSLPLRADYTLTNDMRFYAVPNVQEISNQTHLDSARNNLSGKYILLNSIDLNETGAGFGSEGWIPIGDYSNKFTGIFNGDFNNITNFWINTTTGYIGFFTYVENATIRNLEIRTAEGKEIRGLNFIGGIAGYARLSNITNACFAGNVNGNKYVSGIAGYADYGNVTDSYSAGNISGGNSVGGIAGSAWNTAIRNNAAINPSITGEMNVNRVFGSFRNSIFVSNNFALNTMVGGVKYDGMTNSFSNSSDVRYHGIDKTQIELKTRSTYENDEASGGLGFKFGDDDDNPWKIDPNKNNGYPYLYWQDMR